MTNTAVTSHSGQTIRAATLADIDWVHANLLQAIDDSAYYGERFKAHERVRFSKTFLVSLLVVDPWHVTIGLHRGQRAGFVITLPEFGTIWTAWVYTVPEFSKSAIGLAIMRKSIAHWDNGRFHKTATYVKPENIGGLKIFLRFGFREVALLKHQVLGEDFILLERDLTKTVEGYDSGINVGRLGRLKYRIAQAFKR